MTYRGKRACQILLSMRFMRLIHFSLIVKMADNEAIRANTRIIHEENSGIMGLGEDDGEDAEVGVGLISGDGEGEGGGRVG